MNDNAIKVMKNMSAMGIQDKNALLHFGLEDFVNSDLKKSDLTIVNELQVAVKEDLFAYLMGASPEAEAEEN